jgi:hypothetical protein
MKIELLILILTITNISANYISTLDKSTFQIIEKDLRYLQTSIIRYNSACSFDTNYIFPSTTSTSMIIRRRTHNPFIGDGFIIFDDPYNKSNKEIFTMNWTIKLRTIGDANMFIGICQFHSFSCKIGKLDEEVFFSGVSITYFGDNCFHIDHYVNNGYWTTARHCLSEYELKNMSFDYSFKGNGSDGQLSITYDNFKYYDAKILNDKNTATGSRVENISPCILLYVKDTELEFVK